MPGSCSSRANSSFNDDFVTIDPFQNSACHHTEIMHSDGVSRRTVHMGLAHRQSAPGELYDSHDVNAARWRIDANRQDASFTQVICQLDTCNISG